MNEEEIIAEVLAELTAANRRRRRPYAAGLLISFVDLLLAVDAPSLRLQDLASFYTHFPRVETNRTGEDANQLIVQRGDGATVGIRRFYDAILRDIYSLHRFDYPSSAPYATGRWSQFERWLKALVPFDEITLRRIRERVFALILENLPSQEFDPSTVRRDPPLFRDILREFEMAPPPKEPTGASYQGVVFGFLRADNSHLQVQVQKVRTGGTKVGMIGDVDGWDAEHLVISAEVKQYNVADITPELEDFAHKVNRRGAIGMVVAESFEPTIRSAIEERLMVRALDLNDLFRIVELWDPLKQRTAVSAFMYYASHIERNSVLTNRLSAFIREHTDLDGVVTAANITQSNHRQNRPIVT